MTGLESAVEYLVERMLEAGKALGRVVVLVVDMDVSIVHGSTRFVRKQAFIHVSLRRLGCELHHHAGRRVGIHVGILPGDVIRLG